MSARGEEAAATLVRLGLDPEAVRGGRVEADAVAPLLAGADGAALVAALGELPSAEVAALLVALEPRAGERAVRKAIRRALYRLRQRGVPVPEPAAPAATRRAPAASEAEGFLSLFDGRGDRLIWIVRPLPSGGALLVAAQVNEPEGLRDVSAGEASRKQIRAARQKLEADSHLRLVAADWRTLDALLVEAHARAGGGAARERDYLRLRPRLTSEPPRPPAEPVSTRVTAPSAEESAALAAGSAALLEEPELRPWFPPPEAAAPFVEEIAGLRDSPLVLSRAAEEERVREILGRAARALFPPAVLARRLEGTAYLLAETGRAPAARRALAVALLLRARPADAMEIPLVAALVERAVGGLLAQATARAEEERRGALVVTPGQFLRDRTSSRRGRTPG
ncbi:MAG TPA: hypothetical protein VE997_07015 [Candidatus Limnocylindria bacterium]|nr:hypothetical protein [Candidatus Limnocylindria bacterium]